MATLIILVLVLAVAATVVTTIVRGIAAGKTTEADAARLRQERRVLGPVPGLVVRPLVSGDRAEWLHHWDGYCDFYGAEVPETATDTTWSRLMDPASPVKGYGAFDPAGNLLGFAHVVLHPHTWSPKTLCYLEDLYVAPPHRGRDVGHSLISHLWKKAADEGWARVYWHTEATNASARRLYDRFRPADGYVRYTLTL